jgi:hypothetical protein
MPSRICKFLADLTPEKREKMLATAPQYIKTEEVLNILKNFDINNPKKNSRMANQLSAFLEVPGLQRQVTDWICSAQ